MSPKEPRNSVGLGLPSPSGGELPRARGEVSPESAMADEGRGVCGPGVEAWAAATTSSCPLDERGGRALPQTCKIAQVYCVCEWRGGLVPQPTPPVLMWAPTSITPASVRMICGEAGRRRRMADFLADPEAPLRVSVMVMGTTSSDARSWVSLSYLMPKATQQCGAETGPG